MTDLSKKDAKFDWTISCDSAFKALKRALTTAPVLAFPDIDKPFELVCDASGIGLGAVLLQEGRPLAYYSRKMTAAECNYIVTEQELLATVEALRVFRCYLLSGKRLLIINQTRFCKLSHCYLGVKLAGVSTCIALTSTGCTDLVDSTLLIL